MNSAIDNPLYRIVLIGDSTVGKTSILQFLISDTIAPNPQSTIGANFVMHHEIVNGKPVDLQVWDTGGQEKFMSLAPIYFR
jgi:small GTP-binding protein